MNNEVITLARISKIMNGQTNGEWHEYGDVTHIKAAEEHAIHFPFKYSFIETKKVSNDGATHGKIFTHEVSKIISYQVKTLTDDDLECHDYSTLP